MNEIDVYQKMNEIVETPQFSLIFGDTSEQTQKLVPSGAMIVNMDLM